jgi:Ni,Fe-hydrogenase maturation factor
MHEAPGTIHRFDHETLLELPEQAGSAHHLPFGVGLRWLLHANPDLRDVRFRLWGAEPASVSPRRGLSRRAQAAVHGVAEEIRDSALGRTVHAAEGLRSGAW